MSELFEHTSETTDGSLTFDRETLGAILVRHPWAVRFVLLEAFLLAIVGIIPLIWTSDLFHALFGMVLSLAMLAAFVAGVAGLIHGFRRARHAVRY